MEVWNRIENYPADRGPVVATIGNYDGIHLGHSRILASLGKAARARGLPSLVLTFDPHPMTVVAPDRRPKLLMTRRQKLDELEAAGVDGVLFIEFDRDLAALPGREFFASALGSAPEFAEIHVGSNFRFGRGRTGDLALLRAIGAERGFDVCGIEPVQIDGRTVSSSLIRGAIEDGEVRTAARYLGRPFTLTGLIVHGEGRGRRLSFPTANLDTENEIVPRRGVYVTECLMLAMRHPSVTNVGVRPTFGGDRLVVESHLIEYDDSLYDERMEVRFLDRLRDELRFDSPDELSAQIARDRAAAAAYFRNLELEAR